VKLIIAAAIMLASAAAHGQVMKCVSLDGRVEYANRCPAGTAEHQTPISTKASGGARAPAAPASAQKSLVEQSAAFNKRQLEQREAQQKAQKVAAEQAQKNQACESARSYLQTLDSGARLRSMDPKTGEIGYLDDARRTAERAKAAKAVEDHCK
jgi:hypothetical protein